MQNKSPPSSSLDMLLSRVSTDALQEPAPRGETLELILATALRAPDHGKLRPWRYIVVQGDQRPAFAREIVAALERRDPDVPDEKKQKILKRFSNAPALIVLGMSLRMGHKIPESEQIMATAAGTMNILNGLYAEGFGGIWVSGAYCEEPELVRRLGLAPADRLAGILMVGTPKDAGRKTRRPEIKDYMAYWHEGEIPVFGAAKEAE
ncbi:nitroreductase [Acetobacteraceae bacterium ESL0709]|nr:nitroreductase [Acetobacteraceae bacterium ESL0697]MDF7678779.1 nitroreductase [Acetobacteraceae bacterium ESL0709]